MVIWPTPSPLNCPRGLWMSPSVVKMSRKWIWKKVSISGILQEKIGMNNYYINLQIKSEGFRFWPQVFRFKTRIFFVFKFTILGILKKGHYIIFCIKYYRIFRKYNTIWWIHVCWNRIFEQKSNLKYSCIKSTGLVRCEKWIND